MISSMLKLSARNNVQFYSINSGIIFLHIHTYTYIHTHTCTNTYIYIHILYIHMYIYTYLYMYTHTYSLNVFKKRTKHKIVAGIALSAQNLIAYPFLSKSYYGKRH